VRSNILRATDLHSFIIYLIQKIFYAVVKLHAYLFQSIVCTIIFGAFRLYGVQPIEL